MLQQTQVATVIDYFHRFTKAFPTVEALAHAKEDRVLKLWEGLGYYSRARNLHKAAKQVLAEYGGIFPQDAEGWLRLSGVGRYTANAVASIVYGEQVGVLDGNVKRVLSRIYAIEEEIEQTATLVELQNKVDALVPKTSPGDFNQGLMEIGERVCRRDPNCGACPVNRFCQAYARGIQKQLPKRRPKKKTPHRLMVAAVIQDGDKYLIGRRPNDGMLAGLWEFPGGERLAKETQAKALERNLSERLGVKAKVGKRLTTVNHAYTHFTMDLAVLQASLSKKPLKKPYYTHYRWVKREQLKEFSFHKANHKFFPFLID